MEVNRIFSAEQIVVPPELPEILKEYSKAVIRAKPDDIVAFSAEYFQKKLESDGSGAATKQETREANLAN